MRKDQSVFVVTLAAFMLVIGTGCGGSGSSKPASDGGTDLAGAGGVLGSGGGGTGGRGGTGGTIVVGDGGGAGADGSATDLPATGNDAVAGSDVPKADVPPGDGAAADVPVSTDTAADAAKADSAPEVIIAIDGGPTVVVCPADVATAACTTGDVCLRTGGEACGCLANSRWFCPGLVVGTDGGVTVTDASPDLPALGTCAAGVAADQPCTTLGAVCSLPGTLGCACFGFGGNLRWLCGP